MKSLIAILVIALYSISVKSQSPDNSVLSEGKQARNYMVNSDPKNPGGINEDTSSVRNSNPFWKGDIINSSESNNSRLLVDGTLYTFENKSWKTDIKIDISFPTAYDIDASNNIWVFKDNRAWVYSRTTSAWSFLPEAPISIPIGKVYGNYVYCGNHNAIYRYKYTSPGSVWELLFDCSAYDGDYYLDFCVNDNVLYVAKYLFEVIKSDIGTNIWQTLLRTPTSPAKIKVTDDLICVGTYWNGVLTSTDSGVTWINGPGLPGGGGENFLVKNKNEIFVLVSDQASTKGWYYSNDAGNSFVSLTSDLNHWVVNQMRDLQVVGDQIIINADYRGFYLSNDYGNNWVEINNGYNDCKPHHVIKIINSVDNGIIALSSNGGVPLPWYRGTWGIFKSYNGGLTWDQIDKDLFPDYKIIEDIIETSSGDLVVAPYDPGTLYIQKQGTSVWTRLNVAENILNGTIMGSTFEILEKGADGTIYAGTFWDGILKSEDGGYSWMKLDYGVQGRGVRCIETEGEKIYIISSDQAGYVGVYFSGDAGVSWQKINDNGIEFNLIKVFQSMLIGTSGSHVYLSEDNGITWKEISDNLSSEVSVRSLVFINTTTGSKSEEPSNVNLVIGTNKGVYQKHVSKYGWNLILNTVANCICYSEQSRQIHFGFLESLITQTLNPITFIHSPVADNEWFSITVNPGNSSISISGIADHTSIRRVRVINLSGQVVADQANQGVLNINMSHCIPGLYIVIAEYPGGKVFSKKFVLSR